MEQVVVDGLLNLCLMKEEEEEITITMCCRSDLLEECSLSLFGKLLSNRQQNQRALKNTLRLAWKMGSDLQIVDVGHNVLQWRRGLTASNIDFSHAPFWVQVWGLPFEMMDDEVGKELGNSLGKFIEMDKRMGHDDKHCPETSDWRNATRQYGDWLRANGKVGFDKLRSTSSGDRDENGGDRDAENVQTTARIFQASTMEGGEGSSGIGRKQTLSDKGSMMGWEVTGSPMCQSAQKLDGQNKSIQIQMECAPEQNSFPRANLDSSLNGPFGVMDKDRRAGYVLSDVGQQVNVEKEMMDVSSPSKPKTSPTNTKNFVEDNLSPKGEENGKAIRHWKRIAREKGKNISPTSEIQTQILRAK
nr:hypothetical protein CFP56_06946 [Quercus suber]